MGRILAGSGQAVGEDGIPVIGEGMLLSALNETTVKAESVPIVSVVAGSRQRLRGVLLSCANEVLVSVQDESTVLFNVLIPAKGTVNVTLPERGYLLKAEGRITLKPATEQKLNGALFYTQEVVA